MRIRRLIVTKIANLADLSGLADRPDVMSCWRLPRGYVLFEFYHPVFEQIYDSDVRVANDARRRESVRAQTAVAVSQERGLLSPLYRDIGNPSDAVMLLLPSRTATYQFLGKDKGRVRWPEMGSSPDWETSRKVRISGRLATVSSETFNRLQMVLKEWWDAMAELGEIREMQELALAEEYFSSECEFVGPCGDGTVALYALLTETRKLTSIEAVGFFLPDDFTSPFRQIGGPGRSQQQARGRRV